MARSTRLPPEAEAFLRRYAELCAAELADLDAAFLEAASQADWRELLALVEEHCVRRLQVVLHQMQPIERVPDKPGLNPQFKALTDLAVSWVETAIRPLAKRPREAFLSGLVLRLKGTAARHLAAAHSRAADAHTAATVVVTAAIRERRRALVAAYRKHHDLTAEAFARRAHMSDTAVRGIVAEDRRRYAPDKQAALLKLLGIKRDEWYRP